MISFSSLANGVHESLLLILLAGALAIFSLNHKNRKAWLVSVAILFFVLGAWRTNLSFDGTRKNLSDGELGPKEFAGVVSTDPEINEKYQKIVVRGKKSEVSGEKILIDADLYPVYNFGDELRIRCVLQEPKNYEDSRFDYQMYLAKDGIYRVCGKPQITLVAKNKGNKIYAAVLAIKNTFEEKLSAVFPDPEGAYLKGLLLGGSKRMPEKITDAFSKTGTMHTVAVSGYNVTIVTAFLMWLGIFLGLWRQQVFSFAVIGIVLFVLMTGAPSSAVRAGIMGALVVWAIKEGRLANSQNAILVAAAAMLAVNPLLLRYDAGFQLSFLATLGIVWLAPAFERYFKDVSGVSILKETIFLSIAAQIFVLPVILANFENLSLISPVANLLILPAIPYIMLGGFAAGMAGFVFVPLGKLIGFIPFLLLKTELAIVQWLAGLSWASLEIKNFGWVYVSVYYALLGAVLIFYNKRHKKLFFVTDEK